MRINNYHKTWNETKQDFDLVHTFAYPHRCTEDDFLKTDMEIGFWDNYASKKPVYCISEDDNILI